jgi:biotin/methionine sulfoxide reductase
MSQSFFTRTATHWGSYDVETRDGAIVALHPVPDDPHPSSIGDSLVDVLRAPNRIEQPMVRAGWLKHGPRQGANPRGAEPFVPVTWDRALELVSGEICRIRRDHGNAAIFAGSYGWASAGRFHHAQSQIHRFMNLAGGFTRSVNSYSLAAGEVIMPHVLGLSWGEIYSGMTDWSVVAAHTRLMVCFGGLPLKNAQASAGGTGRHTTQSWLERAHANGTEFISISPLRGDMAPFLEPEWLPAHPNTDVALMLGLAHTLLRERLHDPAFLSRYCVGFEPFQSYLTGAADGVVKDADWAAAICGLPAATIRALARRMAATRTMINVSWSLQRGEHGEQPFWMATVLAAMLGQIGLPGGGIGYGYAATNGAGNPVRRITGIRLAQGANSVSDFIPVARIADLLLNPGAQVDYDGRKLTYPDTRMVYWAGGNPFHHHQDLNKLLRAWARPETIVVHEPWWNASARHADIVLPVTTSLEREDIASGPSDNFFVAMHQAVQPPEGARDDYWIFAELAKRLGVEEAFTEGRSPREWLRHLYDLSQEGAARQGVVFPSFDVFWKAGQLEFPPPTQPVILLQEFRKDPHGAKLPTPSGLIEIFSERIASFDYADCPGHPAWLPPEEYLLAPLAARFPLHLISNQPATRLHSQLDHGAVSRAGKVADREPVLINPRDAAARGVLNGDVVRIFNDRGACLAGAVVSDDIRCGVIQLATGAWYDPLRPGEAGTLDCHGNPNMLTADRPTSRLAQGPTAHSALVELERWDGIPPPVRAFTPPRIHPSPE